MAWLQDHAPNRQATSDQCLYLEARLGGSEVNLIKLNDQVLMEGESARLTLTNDTFLLAL